MLNRFRLRRKVATGLVAALAVGALLQITNTNPAVSQTQSISALQLRSDPGVDPGSEVWSDVKSIDLPLTAQAGAYYAGGSVTTIRAQVGHFDGRLYVRVTWPDATMDDSTTRAEDFADAVAIEFPANGKASVPSLCMGQADAAVNIWHWRADSTDSSHDPGSVYVNSLIDEEGSAGLQFYTARDAGNPFANPEVGPVQTLSSLAFGELKTLPNQDVDGAGTHANGEWTVVFAREFGSVAPGHAIFEPGKAVDVAFAVWDGSNDERNGRKAVSQFLTMRVFSVGPGGSDGGDGNLMIPLLMFFGFTGLAIGWGFVASRIDGRRR